MRDINKYTEKYLEHNFEDIQVVYRKKEIIKWVKKYNPKNILEIGCGMNPFFVEDIDYDLYIVVEPSEKFVENAKMLANDKVNIIQDFVENRIDILKKEKFDFVILSSLLHEVANPYLFLKSIKEILTNNTILHINVPNSKSFHRLLAYEAGIIKSPKEKSEVNKLLQQTTNFDIDDLLSLVKKLNLNIIDSGSYFIKPFTHKQMSMLLKYKIIDQKILNGFYNMIKYLPELGSEIFVNTRLK